MGRKRERTNNNKDELGWGEDYKRKKKKGEREKDN